MAPGKAVSSDSGTLAHGKSTPEKFTTTFFPQNVRVHIHQPYGEQTANLLFCPVYAPPSRAGGVRPATEPPGAGRAPAPTLAAEPASRCGCLPPGARGLPDGGGSAATGERGAGVGRGVEAPLGVEETGAGGEGVKMQSG
jgi:hypothetical protein